MNREIKFRAWDGEKIIYQSKDGWFDKVKHPQQPVPQCMQLHSCMEVCSIMQFTGLHDKNGKEIYEGDVLRWAYSDKTSFDAKVVFGHYMTGRDSWGVELSTVGFFLQFDDGGICGIDLDKQYEIIGNIYENPELLKQ